MSYSRVVCSTVVTSIIYLYIRYFYSLKEAYLPVSGKYHVGSGLTSVKPTLLPDTLGIRYQGLKT